MLLGDRLVWLLIGQYIVIALTYGGQGAWYRSGYFLCAAGISYCAMRM